MKKIYLKLTVIIVYCLIAGLGISSIPSTLPLFKALSMCLSYSLGVFLNCMMNDDVRIGLLKILQDKKSGRLSMNDPFGQNSAGETNPNDSNKNVRIGELLCSTISKIGGLLSNIFGRNYANETNPNNSSKNVSIGILLCTVISATSLGFVIGILSNVEANNMPIPGSFYVLLLLAVLAENHTKVYR